MRIMRMVAGLIAGTALVSVALAAPPPGKGKGGNDGGEDPPAEFVPAVAYFDAGRKFKDIRLANREGDQACLVLRSDQNGLKKLSGFEFDGVNKRLAYAVGETGIFISSWTSDPCKVVSAGNITDSRHRIRTLDTGDYPETIDFSPYGNYLVWTEPVSGYAGFGTAVEIFIYDINANAVVPVPLGAWGGTRPEWGVDGEWGVGSVRFSPDFATSNELIFVGGPLDGSQGAYYSLFAYNIDGETAPRKLLDGANISFDFFIAVTNPGDGGEAKVAFTNQNTGQIVQLPLGEGEVSSFPGTEPQYSCDNSELIHGFKTGNKVETYLTSADGSSFTQYSREQLRWLDWLCE